MSESDAVTKGGVATVDSQRPLEVWVLGRDPILRSGLSSHLRACPDITVVDTRDQEGSVAVPCGGVVVLATDLIDSDTLTAVRALRRKGAKNILILTSHLGPEQAARAAAAGACRWLARSAATTPALSAALVGTAACNHTPSEHARSWAMATRVAQDAGLGATSRGADHLAGSTREAPTGGASDRPAQGRVPGTGDRGPTALQSAARAANVASHTFNAMEVFGGVATRLAERTATGHAPPPCPASATPAGADRPEGRPTEGAGPSGSGGGDGEGQAAPADDETPEGAPLSPRDLDVLRRIAQGQSTSAIADELAYSESTIKNIVHQAVSVLGARNRTHAVSTAIRRGLI